ncbi:hypothetical protein PIB30_004622 [Stylosanthes scabra]|uniref:Uncharacterized protein n=1 Tax=Stylosanthes scabra TaxID=79078 RepID=A0ABU6Z4I3_9FABA|nr:hypothetical protein [Stylosanthes scabra]
MGPPMPQGTNPRPRRATPTPSYLGHQLQNKLPPVHPLPGAGAAEPHRERHRRHRLQGPPPHNKPCLCPESHPRSPRGFYASVDPPFQLQNRTLKYSISESPFLWPSNKKEFCIFLISLLAYDSAAPWHFRVKIGR